MADAKTPENLRAQQLRGRIGKDELSGRHGELMDIINGNAFLRPPMGGIEWETPLTRVTFPADDRRPS
ncbi:hypothetical protein [Embleya sp. NBC_00896]|uniref:hypothetical protein n=1 Tax=Embleya sp. NBC_00896 TaxID=2975961 RepID=UPI00386DFAA9|nr:hypothetical protein OG928_27870 [Embleya sp. NBC_00896]